MGSFTEHPSLLQPKYVSRKSGYGPGREDEWIGGTRRIDRQRQRELRKWREGRTGKDRGEGERGTREREGG